MQVTETFSDGLKRGYMVVVPAADIEQRRAKRLAELSKTLRLPGFRPGRVPATLVKQRYGGAVTAEVLEERVNTATQELLTDRGLRSASQPKVELVTLEDARDLEFKVELELLPDIAMPDFAAIELTRPKAEPAPEVIDRALQELAKRQRTLETVEAPRPAAVGEILTVDFLGRVDGVAFPGGTGTDVDIEVAGPGFIPGFSEQLEGLAPGETKTIEVSFPAEYGVADLAGKPATFEITAKALKRQILPELDDALADKLGFEGGMTEIREAITRQVQREYDQLSRLRVKRALLDALAQQTSFPVPDGLVDGEFGQIWARLEADRKAGKVDAEDAGKDDETLKAEYRAIAERRVRLGLLLAEIGRVNSITVSNDELMRAMRAEAGRYPGQEAKVMEFFRKNPQATDGLRSPIFEEKVVDFVLELAKVTDRIVTPEELAQEPDMPAELMAAGAAQATEAMAAATGGDEHPAGQTTGTDG